MKAIIFGINSQDGVYLTEILTRHSFEIIGVSRSSGGWIQGSVADGQLVESLVKTHQPSYVFHLAANSTTEHSALFENHETIGTGALNVLEAVYKHCPSAKVFLSGSAMQFENVGQPIDETAGWAAASGYSVARIQSVYAGRYYRLLGLKVYVGYLFNHDSPLRSERHLSQRIVQAAKRIARGSGEMLDIGNLEVRKEYTFAGDVAEAIWLLVNNRSDILECVIGSGRAYSVRDWIGICFGKLNLAWESRVRIKEGFRPDYDILVSNPRVLRSIGWKQRVDIDELAVMMLA